MIRRLYISGVKMQPKLFCTAALITLIMPSGVRAGTISGKVTVDGPTPKQKVIDMSKEPVCVKDYSPSAPPRIETAVTGPDNTLGDVVVYISAGAHDDANVPSQVVTIDQHGCKYIQHITALHVNQTIKITNSDPALHNVHVLAENNREWSESQQPGSQPVDAKFSQPEFIPIKCNVHPWMHGYIIVLKTNHFSVTDQTGKFTLKGLPPGKYTVTAWHELFGTQQQEVTIGGAEETKTINFTFKGRAY
jgi:plastocyanin